MARFDVYANPETTERRHTPYFVDVQNDYIDHLATRVMIPLRREAAFGPRPRNLNPLVKFGDDAVVLDTAALGAVPTSELRKAVGHLRDARPEIQQALDALFGSY
jgi:toxin CcdB